MGQDMRDNHKMELGAGRPLWLRVCHWGIAISILTLAFSGVIILMSHPRLYWGNVGNDLTAALIELPLGPNYKHGGWSLPTHFFSAAGPITQSRIFEIFNENAWARSLHFLVAWFLVTAFSVYLTAGLISGHIWKKLIPTRSELDLRRIWPDLKAHVLTKVPASAGVQPYGLIQKCAYLTVIFLALPTMVLTGLSMSPAVTAAYHFLPDMFGGAQSARTIHFCVLCFLLLFFIIHIVMVIVTGFVRQVKAMIWSN
jgi:thiosulfate reductase cytochrome b subunit